MKFLIVLTLFVFYATSVLCQKIEVIKVLEFERKAEQFTESYKYDSAATYYVQAAQIYEKNKKWFDCERSYRLGAESYYNSYKIDSCINFISKAQNILDSFQNHDRVFAEERAKNQLLLGKAKVMIGEYSHDERTVNSGVELYQSALNILKQFEKTNASLIAEILHYIGVGYATLQKYDKGEEYYLKSLNLKKKIVDEYHPTMAISYHRLGGCYAHTNNFEKAVEYIQKGLNINLVNYGEYHPKTALSYWALGGVFYNRQDYKKALFLLEKSLDIRLQVLDTLNFSIADCYFLIGRTHHNEGNFSRALKNYYKALDIWEYSGSFYNDKKNLTYELIGMIFAEEDHYGEALKYHTMSLKARLSYYGENHVAVAKSYFYIGQDYESIGRYRKALEYYEKGQEIIFQLFAEEHHYYAVPYRLMGDVYLKMQNYNKALEYLEKALNIRTKKYGEKHISCHTIYNSIGKIYNCKKDYEKSSNYLKRSNEILIKSFGEKHHSVAKNYNELGLTYLFKKDYNRALEYYKRALSVLVKIYGYENRNVANTYSNFGETYYKKGNYAEALDYYSKALRIRTNVINEKHPDLSINYNNIGKVLQKRGDYSNAINHYHKALLSNLINFSDSGVYKAPKFLKSYSKPVLIKSLSGKAVNFYYKYKNEKKLEDLKLALLNYDIVFKVVHELRNDYMDESSQLFLSLDSKEIFTNAITTAMELYELYRDEYRFSKVYEYIEKSKSATLSSYLNDVNIKKYWNISDSLLKREKEIIVNRRSLELQVQKHMSKEKTTDISLVQNLQAKLLIYTLQYDSILRIFRKNYPDYYKLKYEQNVASVDNIIEKLGKRGALINYYIADTTLFIAALNKDTLVCKAINIDHSLNQQVVDYHIDIKSAFSNYEMKRSIELYNYLIKPIEEVIENKKSLIIIPDGNLYYVPFETLCKGEANKMDIANPDYLIKSYSISYHQSATLWLNSLEKSKEKELNINNFLGFAPVFNPQINNGYIFSNEWIADTTDIELATRSVSYDLKHLNALPDSEKEINAILELFKKNGKQGIGYLHKSATEGNFKQKIPNYKYIHIASHSFTNDKYPALSGIAFSQPDTLSFSEGKNEDGILYAGESYNLNLKSADLVVLSSCKSGLGKLAKGEGFLSLSRGFLYSGVPNIVFSLWNVKDEQTKDLMIFFYKKVLKGKTYAKAMRESKLKLINNPKTSEPKYWAPWILVGK